MQYYIDISKYSAKFVKTIKQKKMELNSDLLKNFIGGQIEVQNQEEGYIYRGEIKNIDIKNGSLDVQLSWLAKGEGYPPLPTKWIKDDNLTYQIDTSLASISNISDGRMAINISITGELSILYPFGGSKLDSSKVEGLDISKIEIIERPLDPHNRADTRNWGWPWTD